MESFCKSGFGTLLLLLTQIRSIISSWSTDIYLQANQQAAAINFYKSVGFKKTEENSQSYLPLNWQFQINVDVIPTFYIKFIDNQTIKEEARKRAAMYNEEPNYEDGLHLMKLSGPIKTLHYLCWKEEAKKIS